jgi:hypothetical protein
VIIPVLTQHYPMLQRNLLYTRVTRGKRLVVLVGQKKAIAIAAHNASSRRRWSKLGDWLRLEASRGFSNPTLAPVGSWRRTQSYHRAGSCFPRPGLIIPWLDCGSLFIALPHDAS